jgi:hypothetical protein
LYEDFITFRDTTIKVPYSAFTDLSFSRASYHGDAMQVIELGYMDHRQRQGRAQQYWKSPGSWNVNLAYLDMDGKTYVFLIDCTICFASERHASTNSN